MKKRLGAFIMTFTMILGIFSGIRVDMVWADEGGQDGNDAAVTGLAVAYLFDWDEDNKPSLREDAVWEKETETGLGECILYAKNLSDAGEPEGDPIRADKLTLVYCGADGADTPQEGIGTVTALEADGDYLSLQVTKLGVYQLYVTDHADDVVTIKAAYRNFEFCISQTLTQTVKDTKGKVLYTVETNAKNLVAGKKLTLVKIVDGKQILVTKPVTVSKSGNVSVNAGTGEYKLLSASEAKALQKQILKTVKPEQKELAVEKGEKAKVKLNSKLDMNNVASVTYNCSDTSNAKVDKNGKVTTKKKGTATITMTVTLNDGSTKRIATTITVK